MTSATLVEIFHHGHVNRASKLANTRNKAKKRAELHAWILEGMLNLSVGLFNSIQWQRLTWYPNTRLYPNVPFDKATDKPTRHPTPAEVQKACKFADRNFYLMNAGRPVLLDPRNPESVIAIMDFTLWNCLTKTNKAKSGICFDLSPPNKGVCQSCFIFNPLMGW
ncbi:hypothetical protein PGT21_000145 [Puccinia graminis f. sp. tritici]|uniref:Uncharacterized protein n=1 Tax=Puccinia graminis f. sp. tritici TaxID=56615 RepID=A0A5B0MS56_PUCGR|nr:hypothetical protein PGT21_000145 [Puccinia graminis f. sp. tritici]